MSAIADRPITLQGLLPFRSRRGKHGATDVGYRHLIRALSITSMSSKAAKARPDTLEAHLQRENPLLLEPLAAFRRLDRIAHRMHLLPRDDSLTRRVPWWPVVSLLGTFSSGKSSFINSYLGTDLQRTGNQAVDDRFSVICYGDEAEPRTLPGSALDADQRFPFYRISGDIDEVAAGEGQRINTYLQLRTCNAEVLRGKILLDSPGFDADSQRSATLRITDHIIDLSDLVLVFFDARHPEPGAMRDTLEHLVSRTIGRDDATKFVFVLNQIDATAREDNPEDVVAAWQRALASSGLTAGRFLRIYDENSASPIEDESLAARFKAKKDIDLAEIHRRMHGVEVDRGYRVVELMTSAADALAGPSGAEGLTRLTTRWRRRTLTYDALVAVPVVLACIAAFIWAHDAAMGVAGQMLSLTAIGIGLIVAAIVLCLAVHFGFRRIAAKQIAKTIEPARQQAFGLDLRAAFLRDTRWWRSLFRLHPKGWHWLARRRVKKIRRSNESIVRRLNDQFTQPSG
ncbi:MAG: dynamin family protein [Salinisphaera sp.]|jgi:GTPase SAR1 family protein|nr:dynamin family protein [Salinisphaera sp.]